MEHCTLFVLSSQYVLFVEGADISLQDIYPWIVVNKSPRLPAVVWGKRCDEGYFHGRTGVVAYCRTNGGRLFWGSPFGYELYAPSRRGRYDATLSFRGPSRRIESSISLRRHVGRLRNAQPSGASIAACATQGEHGWLVPLHLQRGLRHPRRRVRRGHLLPWLHLGPRIPVEPLAQAPAAVHGALSGVRRPRSMGLRT
jgi:hypothetical protein